MALASIDAALTQYNANLSWHTSRASAELALEAVRYLIVNRAQQTADQGSQINFESIVNEKTALEKFLGATAPRAFGRSRRVGAAFQQGGLQ